MLNKRETSLFYLRNLHQLLNNVTSEDMIENHLKELVIDYRQLQLVAVPNQDFRFVNGGNGDLEVVIGADAKVFG